MELSKDQPEIVPLKDKPGGRIIGEAHIAMDGGDLVVTARLFEAEGLPASAMFKTGDVSLYRKAPYFSGDQIDPAILKGMMEQLTAGVPTEIVLKNSRLATEDELKKFQENIEEADQRALFETFDVATHRIKSRMPIPNNMGRDVHHLMMESIDRFGNSNDPVGDYYLKRIREGLFSGEIASTGWQDEEGRPIYLITQDGESKQVRAEELLSRLAEENQAAVKNILSATYGKSGSDIYEVMNNSVPTDVTVDELIARLDLIGKAREKFPEFTEEYVNKLREKHGLPPVRFIPKLDLPPSDRESNVKNESDQAALILEAGKDRPASLKRVPSCTDFFDEITASTDRDHGVAERIQRQVDAVNNCVDNPPNDCTA